MAEEKILKSEEIENIPLPDEEGASDFHTSESTSGGTSGISKINSQSFPGKRVATELLGQALNTKSRKILAEFEFTEMGALQIGKYVSGVSGDLRFSPNGITTRNLSGLTTFAIDGTTGNVVFLGSIQSGSLITGEVVVGDNSVIIHGENRNIIINDRDTDRVLLGRFTT